MAVRTSNRRRYVTNQRRLFRCSDPPAQTYQQLVGPIERWEAVFSREKPRTLKVTFLSYREAIHIEDRLASCERHKSSTAWNAGSMPFCHNSLAGRKVSFDSRSSVPMATALAKARFTSHSYAETLADSRRTSRMIGNRIGTLSALANAIKARDRVRADKIAARLTGEQYVHKTSQGRPISRRFADGWLEYQFGWLPLLSDIYGLVDLYRGRLVRGMQVSRSYTTNGGFSASRGGTTVQRADRIRKNGAASKVAIRTRVTNPALRTLSEMGLLNPASLAWDLLPYSFVVDWIAPISSILKSFLYDIGLEDDDSYSVTEHGSLLWYNPSCCGGYVTNYERNVVRQPLVAGVLPGLFTNPRDMGLWHIVTSTALLRQQFKGGRI